MYMSCTLQCTLSMHIVNVHYNVHYNCTVVVHYNVQKLYIAIVHWNVHYNVHAWLYIECTFDAHSMFITMFITMYIVMNNTMYINVVLPPMYIAHVQPSMYNGTCIQCTLHVLQNVDSCLQIFSWSPSVSSSQ